MEFISTATETITTVMSTVINTITTTPVLALCFTAGTIIPIGIRIFKKLK